MARYAKIEKYLSGRLWNARLNGHSVTLKKLMAEIEKYHRINLDDPKTNHKIRQLIAQARKRINRRYCEWKARRKQWAAILHVPEDLVESWYKDGLIKNKRQVDALKVILEDFDILSSLE